MGGVCVCGGGSCCCCDEFRLTAPVVISRNAYVLHSRDDRVDVRRSSQSCESISLSEARYHVTYFNIVLLLRG